ncbi:pimeloyl-ACP methyl ester carboxylesterase [Sphingomonas zeicaulis]|uniref:alpha/beta fold hydrolase n=1 Tax=Sphingomonas zeicaulis TaxID=1632740 RepID=UPI003D1BB525
MRRFIALFAGLLALTPALAVAQATPLSQKVPLAQLRTKLGKPADRYLKIAGGVELRYRDEGKGPVLLLLHGSRSSLASWDPVVARLVKHYRIVRFDQPPTGLSGPLSNEAVAAVGSPENMVLQFLDQLKIDKVTILGTSSGGTLAYYFAATYPDRVDGLILSNTPSDPVSELKPVLTPEMEAANARAKTNGLEDRPFWRTYFEWLWGDRSRITEAQVDAYYNYNLRGIDPNYTALQALTSNKAPTMARLDAVKAPVLVIWGMRDPVLPPYLGDKLFGYLKNAKGRSFIALEDVGHYPPVEVPDRYAELALAWLKAAR